MGESLVTTKRFYLFANLFQISKNKSNSDCTEIVLPQKCFYILVAKLKFQIFIQMENFFFFGGFCVIDVLKKIDFVTSFHKKPFHFTFRNLIYILSSQTLWRLNGEYPSDYVFNLYHRKNSNNKI